MEIGTSHYKCAYMKHACNWRCSTVQGPHQVASRMVNVLKHIIGESSWTNARLLDYLVTCNLIVFKYNGVNVIYHSCRSKNMYLFAVFK